MSADEGSVEAVAVVDPVVTQGAKAQKVGPF